MKSNTKLLILALLFIRFISTAQQNDTLKIKRNDDGIITFIKFAPRSERTMANGKTVLKGVLKLEQKEEFRLQKENMDKYGITHQRYQQYYNGIKVIGAEYLVHGKNRIIETINGNYSKVGILSTSPQLTEQQALDKALAFVNSEVYKWEDEGMEKFIKENTNNPKATYFPIGEMIIVKDTMKKKGTFKLGWKFTISSLVPYDEQNIYVDAITGEVIGKVSLLLDVNTPGIAQTMFSGTKNITCDSYSGGYRLRENRNSVIIQTFDLQNQGINNLSSAVDFTNTNTNWSNGSWAGFAQDRQALDAHWGAEQVYDYWNSVHNRNSIDGHGIAIKSYVHFGSNVDNAYWDSSNHVMLYGDGDVLNPLVALDICAHEFGHGLNQFEANLGAGSGWNESDALNEGFSDIWGAVIENWSAPEKEMWLMGEELFGIGSYFNCIRDMQNPKSTTAIEGQHPDTYQGDFWRADGEPHNNSTILSHWFYILSEGSSATDGINDNNDTFSISGIGVDSAAAIVYQAQMNYLTSSSNYLEVREATILAAEDIYGTGSIEAATTCQSWFAVGVGDNNCFIDYPISGNDVICQSSTYTYTVSGLPQGTNVSWAVSPNLQIVSSTLTSVTVSSTTSSREQGSIYMNINGSVSELNVWLGPPASASKILGPTLVNTGALVNYSTSTISGASSYEWRLPYPYDIVTTFDYFGQRWQLQLPGNGTQIKAFTGYGKISGYVQVWGKNECGTGGAKFISVSHTGSGSGGGGAIPILDGVFSTSNDTLKIEVYNFYGEKVASSKKNSIDLTLLPSGIYIIKIWSNQGEVITKKVLK